MTARLPCRYLYPNNYSMTYLSNSISPVQIKEKTPKVRYRRFNRRLYARPCPKFTYLYIYDTPQQAAETLPINPSSVSNLMRFLGFENLPISRASSLEKHGCIPPLLGFASDGWPRVRAHIGCRARGFLFSSLKRERVARLSAEIFFFGEDRYQT